MKACVIVCVSVLKGGEYVRCGVSRGSRVCESLQGCAAADDYFGGEACVHRMGGGVTLGQEYACMWDVWRCRRVGVVLLRGPRACVRAMERAQEPRRCEQSGVCPARTWSWLNQLREAGS